MKILSVILAFFSLCVFLTDAIASVCQYGERQSPIALQSTTATYTADDDVELLWESNRDIKGSLKNTGNALKMEVEDMWSFIKLGNLQYRISHLEFIWGSEGTKASEHSIDGEFFSGELELIFKKGAYPTIEEALDHSDGFIIASVLLRENDNMLRDLYEISEIAAKIPLITRPNTHVEYNPDFNFSLKHFLSGSRGYFKYDGSFSSGYCEEAATRIVLKDPIDVTSTFLKALRSMRNGDQQPMADNNRVIQPIQARTVYRNFKNECAC